MKHTIEHSGLDSLDNFREPLIGQVSSSQKIIDPLGMEISNYTNIAQQANRLKAHIADTLREMNKDAALFIAAPNFGVSAITVNNLSKDGIKETSQITNKNIDKGIRDWF